MSNIEPEDIALWQEQGHYRLNNGDWEQLIKNPADNEDTEWVGCYAYDVPLKYLLVEYENLLDELSLKEEHLIKLNEQYKKDKFNIMFIADIDFKALYGKANDKIREHHVTVVCKNIIRERRSLELSIDYLKRYLIFLKTVINSKLHGG